MLSQPVQGSEKGFLHLVQERTPDCFQLITTARKANNRFTSRMPVPASANGLGGDWSWTLSLVFCVPPPFVTVLPCCATRSQQQHNKAVPGHTLESKQRNDKDHNLLLGLEEFPRRSWGWRSSFDGVTVAFGSHMAAKHSIILGIVTKSTSSGHFPVRGRHPQPVPHDRHFLFLLRAACYRPPPGSWDRKCGGVSLVWCPSAVELAEMGRVAFCQIVATVV